jgi:hypothetical protein
LTNQIVYNNRTPRPWHQEVDAQRIEEENEVLIKATLHWDRHYPNQSHAEIFWATKNGFLNLINLGWHEIALVVDYKNMTPPEQGEFDCGPESPITFQMRWFCHLGFDLVLRIKSQKVANKSSFSTILKL